jgi:hypothetical protein
MNREMLLANRSTNEFTLDRALPVSHHETPLVHAVRFAGPFLREVRMGTTHHRGTRPVSEMLFADLSQERTRPGHEVLLVGLFCRETRPDREVRFAGPFLHEAWSGHEVQLDAT